MNRTTAGNRLQWRKVRFTKFMNVTSSRLRPGSNFHWQRFAREIGPRPAPGRRAPHAARLLRQWRQAACRSSVLSKDLLDLLRGGVERLAGARLADQRLIEAQAQDLLDL